MKKHPEYGYDMNVVPHVHCLICHEPIGEEPYVEVTILARFGVMMFAHKRCETIEGR